MKKKSEAQARGGFVLTFEPGRSEKLDAALRYGKAEVTEAFSASDWKLFEKELVLLSFSLGADSGGPRTIDGVALMERMQVNAATGKLKMRLHSPVMFDDPVKLIDLPKAFRSTQLLSTSISLRRIPQETWTELLGQVKRLRPAYARGINRLVEQQFEDHRIFPVDGRTVRLMEQRDAIGTVIDIAGLDRKGILESADTRMELNSRHGKMQTERSD